ncbi:hypothetical protein ES703_96087 [subsurface metagenome]
MVFMFVGEEDCVDLCWMNSKLFHVRKQDFPVCACIEKDGLFQSSDETGKSPVCLEVFTECIIVVDDGHLEGMLVVHPAFFPIKPKLQFDPAIAWSKSSFKSSNPSQPTERRTKSSVIPAFSRSSFETLA